MSSTTHRTLQELEDAFIKVTFEPDTPAAGNESSGDSVQDPLYEPWFERGDSFWVLNTFSV